MSSFAIAATVMVVGVIVAAVALFFSRRRTLDLGTVSQEWLKTRSAGRH